MFPGYGAEVYRNEAGEPLGWDYPSTEPNYCDECGFCHGLRCPSDDYEDDE